MSLVRTLLWNNRLLSGHLQIQCLVILYLKVLELFKNNENILEGVVLTTCTTGGDTLLTLENLHRSASRQSLRVPFVSPEGNLMSQPLQSMNANPHVSTHSGEYSLFGGSSSSTVTSQSPGSTWSGQLCSWLNHPLQNRKFKWLLFIVCWTGSNLYILISFLRVIT